MNKTQIKIALIITIIFLQFDSFSQNADFKYWKESCDCFAEFDSTIYTREQLQNTFDYILQAPYIETSATAWTLEEIKELNVDTLRNECKERLEKLNTLGFIDNEYWTEQKLNRIKEIESTCRLREITILAYSNPDTLMFYNLVDSTCIHFRDALIVGGQQMIDTWINFHEIRKSKNGNPEKFQRKFDEKYNSRQRIEYARLELMQFGWWNSANHLIYHYENSHKNVDGFEKLFIEFECDCDEP